MLSISSRLYDPRGLKRLPVLTELDLNHDGFGTIHATVNQQLQFAEEQACMLRSRWARRRVETALCKKGILRRRVSAWKRWVKHRKRMRQVVYRCLRAWMDRELVAGMNKWRAEVKARKMMKKKISWLHWIQFVLEEKHGSAVAMEKATRWDRFRVLQKSWRVWVTNARSKFRQYQYAVNGVAKRFNRRKLITSSFHRWIHFVQFRKDATPWFNRCMMHMAFAILRRGFEKSRLVEFHQYQRTDRLRKFRILKLTFRSWLSLLEPQGVDRDLFVTRKASVFHRWALRTIHSRKRQRVVCRVLSRWVKYSVVCAFQKWVHISLGLVLPFVQDRLVWDICKRRHVYMHYKPDTELNPLISLEQMEEEDEDVTDKEGNLEFEEPDYSVTDETDAKMDLYRTLLTRRAVQDRLARERNGKVYLFDSGDETSEEENEHEEEEYLAEYRALYGTTEQKLVQGSLKLLRSKLKNQRSTRNKMNGKTNLGRVSAGDKENVPEMANSTLKGTNLRASMEFLKEAETRIKTRKDEMEEMAVAEFEQFMDEMNRIYDKNYLLSLRNEMRGIDSPTSSQTGFSSSHASAMDRIGVRGYAAFEELIMKLDKAHNSGEIADLEARIHRGKPFAEFRNVDTNQGQGAVVRREGETGNETGCDTDSESDEEMDSSSSDSGSSDSDSGFTSSSSEESDDDYDDFDWKPHDKSM